MKLSTRARYGLKALIDLGLHCETEAVSIQSIAGRQNISDSYLEQLMAKLKKAGLVESTRGAGGGYRLGRPAEEISVGDVLRVLEGSLEAAQCSGWKMRVPVRTMISASRNMCGNESTTVSHRR